jgi:hypothetical protein
MNFTSTRATEDSPALSSERPCAEFIAAQIPSLIRRIRSIRAGQAIDWQLRTSELFSTAARRILTSPRLRTAAVERRAFFAILDSIVRNAIVDRVRRARCEARARQLLAKRPSRSADSAARERIAELIRGLSEEDRLLVDAKLRPFDSDGPRFEVPSSRGRGSTTADRGALIGLSLRQPRSVRGDREGRIGSSWVSMIGVQVHSDTSAPSSYRLADSV